MCLLKNKIFIIVCIILLLICACLAPYWLFALLYTLTASVIDFFTLISPLVIITIIVLFIYSFVKHDYSKFEKLILGLLYAFIIGLVNVLQNIAGYDNVMGLTFLSVILTSCFAYKKHDLRFYLIPLGISLMYLLRYYWLL